MSRKRMRRAPVLRAVATVATAAAAILAPTGASAATEVLADFDQRAGKVAPSAKQRAAVKRMHASVTWNEFGTPHTLIRRGGYLASRIRATSAPAAARAWLQSRRRLFRLSSLEGLRMVTAERLRGSNGYVVVFEQSFDGLRALQDGNMSVGLVGSRASGWKVAYVSSTITGDTALSAARSLSAQEAWLGAAASVGRGMPGVRLGAVKSDRGWAVFRAPGLAQMQRARFGALPTANGVRPAYEALVLDVQGGAVTAFQSFVDAANGEVLVRRNLVHQSHQATGSFSGEVPATDGACGPRHNIGTVASGEEIGSVVVSVEATLTTNDSVIRLYRDDALVATQDTLTSPEILVYDPADSGEGTYESQVCDYVDGHPWDDPRTYTGQYFFNPVDAAAGVPYPPKWKVFPANPLIGNQTFPWNYPSADIREIWCWESSVGFPSTTLPECDREVQNLASRVPWDYDPVTNTPTFTTSGNNAESGEAWTSPLTPGAFGFRPVSPQREYIYPWTNIWHTSQTTPGEPPGCFTPFVPGSSHDISAAVTNLFAMHNRMHDWSYFLGFDERFFNAQDSNFGTGGTAQNDSVIGNAQAGALDGGSPSYLGRDNANMIPLPDGVHPITNMYLWQPIAGTFYAPCADGDYDMAVIGHEYGHLTENRMIGKGGTRGGHHAGAMGESFGDFSGAEYLNEYGFVPVSGENPFSVGAYVTGNKDRAIRSYGMNFPRTGAFPTPGVSLVRRGGPLVNPLNFSDHGFDITGAQVHADGEIWSATNYDIRQALVAKYNAAFPAGNRALQEACADGEQPASQCPGNRRWIQIVFDAMKLMPVAPSMLQARDAYLAADMMRFGGANQTEIWLAFARRGFGQFAFSTNTASNENDADPRPNFASPLQGETSVTFRAVAADEGNAPIATARVYVGHYEARVSPIADTNPATSSPAPGNNLDSVAGFVAGTYEFVAHAPGYGHVRFRQTFSGSGATTITISLPTNRASTAKGATASGDGTNHQELIDDTEGTSWDRTGAQPDVSGSQVTVDLQGGSHSVNRVQVSALLEVGRNRFTALRQFRIQTCMASVANGGCTLASGFATRLTSSANAFPGFNPRPVAPEMILRSFSFGAVTATHVRIIVLTNQCTGNTAFQGSQDNDPANGTDCREGSPGTGPIPVFGDLPQVVAPRDNEVHIAELQVFGREGGASRG